MRIWILASATALVAVAGLADAPRAAEPVYSPGVPGTASQRSSPPRARIFPVANAWVNSLKQEAEAAPAAPAPALRPAITGLNLGQGSGGAAVNGYAPGAEIAPTAWNHEHTYSGYVFGPGSCDHTPPCVDHLWDGYCQRPHRCGHHHRHFGGFCGHGSGCSTCGPAVSGCSTCGGGHFRGGLCGCHGFKLHHLKPSFCSSCSTGCDTCAAPACGHGCGHKLFGGLHRGWFGSLCSACDGEGLSCGCGAAIDSHGPPTSSPAAKPEVVPTPTVDDPMEAPAADADAKSARGGVTRYLPWSTK